MSIRLGKVYDIDYANGTISAMMVNGFGVVTNICVASMYGATKAGVHELPVLKSIKKNGSEVTGYVDAPDGPKKRTHLFPFETTKFNSVDLDDDSVNYVYAIIVFPDEAMGKNQPVCIGFVYPDRNQLLFDPDDPPKGLPSFVIKAVKKLKGALIHRTNSDVYWTVDLDGNLEYAHPNGSFFRMAEFPTQEEDGNIHVPLDGANEKAELRSDKKRNGKKTKMAWNTSKTKGSDDKVNAERKLYAHMEVVTEKGTIEIDISKKTGNVTIRTPKDTSSASQSNNQVTIIAGGDATIQSVAGNVTIQSEKKHVDVRARTDMLIKTDSAADKSILIGQGGAHGIDYLVLFNKLKQKFNEHTHTCKGTNKQTAKPDKQLDQQDATFVTQAG